MLSEHAVGKVRINWLRWCFSLILCMAASLALALPSSAAAERKNWDEVQQGDLQLRASFKLSGNKISAHEPVLVAVNIKNCTDKQICLSLGNDTGGPVQFSILLQGKEIASTPKRLAEGFQMARDLDSGEESTDDWILSGLHPFDKPGDYSIIISILGESEPIAKIELPLTVIPYNPKRFKAVCDDLIKPMKDGSPLGDLSWDIRTRMLYTVRDDAVTPYLKWLVDNRGSRYAVRALRRVNGKESLRVLKELMGKDGEIGELARTYASESYVDYKSRMWDMGR